MGQEISCPCHNNDSNVLTPTDEDGEEIVVVAHKVPNSPAQTTLNTTSSTQSTNPFDKSVQGTPVGKTKSRKWDAQPKEGIPGNLDASVRSSQVRVPYDTIVPPSSPLLQSARGAFSIFRTRTFLTYKYVSTVYHCRCLALAGITR